MGKKNQNRLAHEKSPYLLQHADNPVDWYPWGEEAFERAKIENKPVFLSVGYSTCHWCHVMAHESFEDAEIGRLMNETFISIKVDREERPDIDMLYMSVCQTMTGSGGWPLTIIMTPQKLPFFAGTYIPKETRFGRLGIIELVPRIKEMWATREKEIQESASQIIATVQTEFVVSPGEELGENVLHLAYEQLKSRFDDKFSGFGSAPKFPTPHNLLFLLRYWKRTHDSQALNMVEKTLQAMRRGGIFDHLGFGFHRYSTDRQWLVPHFEKMLYDQALLAMAYTEAFQATGNQQYSQTAREVFTYVLRDMTAIEGGFYSAEDADSEGEEGKFYLWSLDEVKQVLAPEDADLFVQVFHIEETGNFNDEIAGGKTGRNILHLSRPLEEISSMINMSVPELQKRFESIRGILFEHREKRIHPHKDDKILTDWNGLMIAALAKGTRVFQEPEYLNAARRAINFIFDKMVASDGRIFHRYRQGEAAIPVHLDDCAFLIYGLLELYETTFDVDYLKKALKINQFLLAHFRDDSNGGFYFISDDGESLPVRQKEIYDGAIPSGNSIVMLNLLRLGRLTADSSLEQEAARIGRAFFKSVSQAPSAYTQLLQAVDFATGPSYEVVIIGDQQADDSVKMLQAIQLEFLPNKIIVFVPAGVLSPEINNIAPFTRDMSMIDNKATAYVCVNHNCKLPTTDLDTMRSLLNLT